MAKLADLHANTYSAGVVKLVYTHGLGPCAEGRRGSSPLTGIYAVGFRQRRISLWLTTPTLGISYYYV